MVIEIRAMHYVSDIQRRTGHPSGVSTCFQMKSTEERLNLNNKEINDAAARERKVRGAAILACNKDLIVSLPVPYVRIRTLQVHECVFTEMLLRLPHLRRPRFQYRQGNIFL
jgi:hypothetical protein